MTMATPRGAMRAKSIGHYTLGKTIGEGTFGKVKLGTHVLTGEKVAVKILEKERIADVADVERVAREIKILKLVQHPHVIQLYEIIETPRQLYLIMEFCNGGELFDHIVQSGRVREAEACRFFHQILGGVEQIHRSGVVHRDLKPENLLLDHQQNIKIVDFGLSNTFQEGQLLKTACGSPCYAAPEMIAGHRYVPSRCDVWSCGVILFALVCGYLPFEDQNTAALYNKILSADYTTPKFISDGVRDLITRMLTTEPDFRITIPRIRQHSWYRQISEASKPFLANEKGELVLDQDVLEQMDRLDFPRNYTVKCLQMRKHNHATATYYLLAEKRSRAGGPAAKQAEFPSIGVEDLPNVGLTNAAISTPRGVDTDGQVTIGGIGFDVPPLPADADSAAGAAPAPQGIFGNDREPALFGLPPPHSARDAGSQSGSRRSLTPLQGQSGASPGAGRATPPAPALPPPPLGDLQPGRARPRSQLQNYQAVYAGRGEQSSTSRTAREPRHSAAATVASAARAGDREASGSRAGAAPRRYSEAPRSTTPRIAHGDARALAAGGRRTPNQGAPHIATPRRPGSQASGHTPRVSHGPSRPGGAGGAAAAHRSQTPSKGAEAGVCDQLPPARRANGRPEQDEMTEGEITRPPTSQGVHAPVRPSVPPPVRNGPQGMEARRRHYTSSSEAPAGRSQRAPSPTSGGASGSTSRTGASVATVDLFGGPRSARGAPAAAWGPALSERGATSRAVSATPDIATDRGANPASAREGRTDEAMRTCRGAFNVSCTSSKAPKQILQEMQRALHLQQVAFKQTSPFLVKCQKHGLRFEMEVAHLDHLESIYVVRFRRVSGELATYKELCSKILADMKI